MITQKLSTLLPIALVSFSSYDALAQKKFELAHVAKLISVSDPQISPDSKSIAIVVSRPGYGQKRFNAELVLVAIASGKQRVLTQDRPTVSQPRWSPSGEQLAFLAWAGQGKEAVNQLFLLLMMGGEAKQLTKTPKGVQHYAWNPDSESIAYVTADEPANKADIEKGHTVLEVGNNDVFIGTQPTPSHIWLVKRPLTNQNV